MVCDWNDRENVMQQLRVFLDKQLSEGHVPSVQPFHAIVYPLAPEQVRGGLVRQSVRDLIRRDTIASPVGDLDVFHHFQIISSLTRCCGFRNPTRPVTRSPFSSWSCTTSTRPRDFRRQGTIGFAWGTCRPISGIILSDRYFLFVLAGFRIDRRL